MTMAVRSRGASIAPLVYGAIGVALFLAVWQWGSTQVTTESTLPSLTKVFNAFVGLLGSGTFWVEAGLTLGLAVLGWILGGLIGVFFGILVGTSQYFDAATHVVFEFFRPIPAIVILPLAVMVLGPTSEMGVFLVVFGITLPITAQTAAGVDAVDPVMRNTARSFGMSKIEILFRVVLPGASPYIGTAMRVSAPITLILCVIAGMLGGAPGIGSSLTLAQIAGRTNDVFAYVIVLGIMGLLVQLFAVKVERKLLHWHSSYREGA